MGKLIAACVVVVAMATSARAQETVVDVSKLPAVAGQVLCDTATGQCVPVDEHDPPLFTPGQTIAVLADCLPQFMFAGVLNERGRPVITCYEEHLVVLRVRKDGWIMVADGGPTPWFINPARIYSFQVKPTEAQAGDTRTQPAPGLVPHDP